MKKLSEFESDKRFTLLQYGETGTGKSFRASQAVQWGPVCFFDFDNKIQSVFEWYKTKPKLLKNIHYDTLTDTGGKVDACLRAYARMRELWKMVQDGTFPYATIVWDSWTGWEQIYLNQVMESNPKFERLSTIVYTDPETKKDETIVTPQQADYRIHAHNESQFINELLSFPCNVIVNAHISIKQEEYTGKLERGMAAAGKLAKHLPKFFSEVHRTFMDGVQYRVQIKSDNVWTCNTRLTGQDSKGIISPSIDILTPMAMTKPYIEEKKEPISKPQQQGEKND